MVHFITAGTSSEKIYNAIDWEDSQKNDCFEYVCDNSKGNIVRSKCNGLAQCVDNRCITPEEMEDKTHAIEIEIDITELTDINTTRIALDLSEMSHTDNNNIVVSVEHDEKGKVAKIICYTSDEKTAEKLKDSLRNNCLSPTS